MTLLGIMVRQFPHFRPIICLLECSVDHAHYLCFSGVPEAVVCLRRLFHERASCCSRFPIRYRILRYFIQPAIEQRAVSNCVSTNAKNSKKSKGIFNEFKDMSVEHVTIEKARKERTRNDENHLTYGNFLIIFI